MSPNQPDFYHLAVSAVVGVLCVVLLTLISAWATPGSAAADPTDALTRLGVPNSSTNLFAWHPILAVLFFLFQTLATLSWVLDFGNGNRQLVKSVHVTLQFGSFACLIALLCVIVQWMAGTPQLTAIHHWLGVIATLLFLCNFMAGFELGFGDTHRASNCLWSTVHKNTQICWHVLPHR